MSAEGVIDLPSPYPVPETADRLQNLLLAKGMKIFARIDQAAEASSVGMTLRPTILLLFGNPKGGTPLMEQFPSLAVDLPLKALIWESDGKACLSYTSPEYLQRRHHLPMTPFTQIPELMAAALK
ncbi:MAG: DUF302 domain-containing protein [Methylacidiphilales bacterium]|nr:DUF302 domain-containing protein [Candidatus Methylacidiphilales bacterium]